jgi:hypothetical protein
MAGQNALKPPVQFLGSGSLSEAMISVVEGQGAEQKKAAKKWNIVGFDPDVERLGEYN